jgi:SnoaL-like protein
MSESELAVAQLILRERQSRDRGWWDRMAGCFAEDSRIDISWFTGSGAEFVRESRRMFGRGDRAVHRLCPPAVQVQGDKALAELPLAIDFRVNLADIEADLVSYARSQYRAQLINGTWRIVRFTSIYERDTLTPAIPGTSLDLDPSEFTGHRRSYRCLSWYLSQRGYRIGQDLLGGDRPEAVAHHYQAEFAWLNE